MLGIHDFALFLAAGILLNLTPGPDTAYIVGRSVEQGRDVGIASALGITVVAFLVLGLTFCEYRHNLVSDSRMVRLGF
jgi:threonine/homoserine/homoserine lactone efflux protein